jgi:ureidoglycolate lyase
MAHKIIIERLTKKKFQDFGNIIDTDGDPDTLINQGLCERYHDRAKIDVGFDGKVGLSLFNAEIRSLPIKLDMMERHPEGSQAFIPMSNNKFLIIVANDKNNRPDIPKAFITAPGQAINFFKGTWHGVLTPLGGSGLFAVIDRIGKTQNLEEFFFDVPYIVDAL